MTRGNRKLNLLFVVVGLTFPGGAERAVFEIVSNLDPNRYNITVCCLKRWGAIADSLKKLGIRVVFLKEFIHTRIMENLQLLYHLTLLMKKEKIDIVHSHLVGANLLSRFAAFLAGVPVVVCNIHTLEVWYPRRLFLDGLTHFLVDGYIAVAEAVKDYTLHHSIIPEKKITVIPNAVDPKKVEPGDSSKKKQELGFKPEDVIIGTVARLSEEKGIDYLIKAAKILSREFPHLHYLIVGNGPLERELKRMTADLGLVRNIHFLGLQEKATEIMDAFDIFVLPSIYEGLPVVLLEAMALSKCIVATRVGGIPEVVEEGRNGILVNPKNESNLAQAIRELLLNKEKRILMGKTSRERAEKEFNIQKIVLRISDLYQTLYNAKN